MGLEQQKEPRYQVTYYTYVASGGQLTYTPSVELAVGWRYAKCSLLILQIFAIFVLRRAHMRKDTRLSRFSMLEVTESWAGPGNEASFSPKFKILDRTMLHKLIG